MNIQLLHPDWRKIPHKEIFGWTDEHQKQEDLLRKYYEDRQVFSLYYKNEYEYFMAIRIFKTMILKKPLATTVEEVLKIITIKNEVEVEYDADWENSLTETLSFHITSDELSFEEINKIYQNTNTKTDSDVAKLNEENEENLNKQQIKQSVFNKLLSFFNKNRKK